MKKIHQTRVQDVGLGGRCEARSRKSKVKRALATVAGAAAMVCFAPAAYAADIGIYWNAANPQQDFAAGDVKAALTAKGLTWVALTSANVNTFVGDKVIIGKYNDAPVTGAYGSATPSLSVTQETGAFDLRNVTSGAYRHYYAVGYDDNGAMYAGIQVADEIKYATSFVAAAPNVLADETPVLKKRGIKMNVPFDRNHPTYNGGWDGRAHSVAIEHVWDINFWKTWFDEMARNRFNTLSIWSENPLRSMVDMSTAGSTKCGSSSITNVTLRNADGSAGAVITMTLAQKVQFWKDVMTYAKNRGFDTYLLTWNPKFAYAEQTANCAEGTDVTQAAVPNDSKRANTVDYFRKGFKLLLNTYPDLTGIGITAGEGFSGSPTDQEKVTWGADVYGQAINDVLNANTTRKLTFIHRAHQITPSMVWSTYSPIVGTHVSSGRLKFDYSFKYSEAHMHAAAAPGSLIGNSNFTTEVCSQNRQTWLEMRNDDFHYLQWADADFARSYINNIPKGNAAGCSANPGFVYGAFMGADGWVDTREFTHKQTGFYGTGTSAMLKIQRHWLRYKVWGRAMYNPTYSDSVVKNALAAKHGITMAQATDLYTAWNKSSRGVQLVNEVVVGNNYGVTNWSQDEGWWPEMWSSKVGYGGDSPNGYRDVARLKVTAPPNGAAVCALSTSATGSCGSLILANTQASNIISLAKGALALLNTANLPRSTNTELDLNLLDIEALAHLGIYGGNKIMGAYNQLKNLNSAADANLDTAYCTWKTYTGQMNDMYTPVGLQRNYSLFTNWGMHDSLVYSDAGNSADCVTNYPVVTINSPANNGTIKTTNGTLKITGVAGSRIDVKVDGLTKTSQIATGNAQTFVIPSMTAAAHVIQVRSYESDGDFTSQTINVTGSASALSCADGILNNGETSVDCGGANCGVCSGPAPTCSDGILNNSETQVDCGGPNCSPCSGTITYINAPFASNSDGFTYADDAWATSSNPAKADGVWSGGKINVSVGGLNLAGTDTNMNGGWSKTFTTSGTGTVNVSFKYAITSDLGIDPGEWVEARVKIDGTSYGQTGPLGTGVNVWQIEAGGDKAEATYTFTSASLAAGTHTITLGAFMNSSSFTTENGTVTFDDVLVTR